MKRVGYLYEKMCDVDFIKTAIRNAAKGKTDRLYVKAILSDIDGYARKSKQCSKPKRQNFRRVNISKFTTILVVKYDKSQYRNFTPIKSCIGLLLRH